MEFYFTPKEYISQTSLTVVDEEAKHLARVLRKKTGEEIFVTDGEGNLYKTRIANISKNIIECDVTEKYCHLNEPGKKVTLYPALIKNPDRFEFIIEKATELGVCSIHPVITENVINKTTSKVERWQSIALSAMKQSQRCVLPKIHEPVDIKKAMEAAEGLKLIAHEKSKPAGIDEKITENQNVSLFIGPEGGFTEEEAAAAIASGFSPMNLGPRKYRSETAAIIALGLILINKI